MLRLNTLRLNSLTFLLVFLTFAVIVPQTGTAQRRKMKNTSLNAAFENAAKEFNVPASLLKALAYAETHFDNHKGEPSNDNGYGLTHLTDNTENQSLNRAAALLGVSADVLKTDDYQNLRGGAAVLRALADEENLQSRAGRQNPGEWYEAVARYSSASNASTARLYADEVYKLLQSGFSGTTARGETIIVTATEVEPNRGKYEWVEPLDKQLANAPSLVASTDYGPALWVAAYSGNYTVSSRPTSYAINYVIIHTTQGSYGGTINWFQNPNANVSAHYVIRSSDGQITQMVREKDIAYHVRGYNSNTIGIEHEGYVDNPSWYTDAMYRASAALMRNICLKYGLPLTRSYIKGHSEMPNQTHTDPGPNWNWTYYMSLVTQSSSWETIVDNQTSGGFAASANWATSSYSAQRYDADYRYANPLAVSDAAWFSANIPSAGNYQIYVWYPASSGYNSATPFVVSTATGSQTVNVNQQINGGAWVSIGTFALNAGDQNVVGVSRWTSTAGYVIADAVKIVRR